jgi:hypothetical protein
LGATNVIAFMFITTKLTNPETQANRAKQSA